MNLNKKEKLHKRLYISNEDLRQAHGFAKYLLKKNLHYKPWEKRGDQYTIQVGLTSSLIVFYCRPFTRSIGLPDLPNELMHYNSEELQLHKKILELRHQVYAHSDGDRYNVRPYALNDISSTSIFSAPFYLLTREEVSIMDGMLSKLRKAVGDRQKEMELELAKRT